ncbi:hypothetical protein GYMLUDRAFT_46356 [Collybiopsis luxurians FD-317 M1]|uniref:NAD-dependent epimerase/dehydratase domain-containing protein n=1 Tax=Collybiopsis luxurians FD-317 M1 TaxID=944289 RepID=A0A0D0CGY5_9AGAR|nr:hypothetical protein GYMLUDRAFT_46356 [Collybiopsis luxurians FD-317 M1]
MPVINTPHATILVSGANGFLATWIVDTLLKKGYKVRAAVRTEAKGQDLLKLFSEAYTHGELELVAVGDIAKENAFDEAVKRVDGIIHTASPVHLHGDHPDEMIQPAVNGTLGMLKSALKFGTLVKRVVFTSSCAAIQQPQGTYPGLDETSWNELSIIECEQKSKEASPLDKYCASKSIAEKRAWDFVAEHASELNWDLSVLNPPWIFGPPLHEVNSLEDLNSSNMYWHKAVAEGEFFGQDPEAEPAHGWVDVRDIAEAHVRALEVEAAGGERMIVSAGSPWVWQDFRDVTKGVAPKIRTNGLSFSTAKEQRILGLKYRTMQEETEDILTFVARKGW